MARGLGVFIAMFYVRRVRLRSASRSARSLAARVEPGVRSPEPRARQATSIIEAIETQRPRCCYAAAAAAAPAPRLMQRGETSRRLSHAAIQGTMCRSLQY